MDLHALLYFKTIAELSNLTRAAELLMISPPALSAALRRLEARLDVPLFDRVGRNLVLNQYGKTYLPYVEQMLALSGEADAALAALRQEKGRQLAIADLMHEFTSRMISDFLQRHPEIQVKRTYLLPCEYRSVDLRGAFDLMLGTANIIKRPDLCHVTLREGDSVVAIVNRKNELATRPSVEFSELYGQRLIVYGEGYPGRLMLDHLFGKTDYTPFIIFEGNSPHAMVPPLDRDLGIFIQPTYTARFNMHYYPSCAAVPITGCSYSANTSIFWDRRQKLSKAAQLFLKFAEAYCKNVPK